MYIWVNKDCYPQTPFRSSSVVDDNFELSPADIEKVRPLVAGCLFARVFPDRVLAIAGMSPFWKKLNRSPDLMISFSGII